MAANGTEVRLRQTDGKFFLTVKSEGGFVCGEIKIGLSKDQFETLWQTITGRQLKKPGIRCTGLESRLRLISIKAPWLALSWPRWSLLRLAIAGVVRHRHGLRRSNRGRALQKGSSRSTRQTPSHINAARLESGCLSVWVKRGAVNGYTTSPPHSSRGSRWIFRRWLAYEIRDRPYHMRFTIHRHPSSSAAIICSTVSGF